MALFNQTHAGVSSVTVRVTPRAGKTTLVGVRDDVLLVTFDLPKRTLAIVPGERSRTKRLVFAGATASAMADRLDVVLTE